MIGKILVSIQLISSILLVIFILLQSKGTGLSSVFGGEGNIYRTRRGLEKGLFILTVVMAILFAGSAFLNLLIR